MLLATGGAIAATSGSPPSASHPPALVWHAAPAHVVFKAGGITVVRVEHSAWLESAVHAWPRHATWACAQLARLYAPLAPRAHPLYLISTTGAVAQVLDTPGRLQLPLSTRPCRILAEAPALHPLSPPWPE